MDGQMSGQSGEEEQQTVVTGEEGIQNGDLSLADIIVYGHNATTHLVYMLLRDSEDGKIGEFLDVDFEFLWKTVNMKEYEFVNLLSYSQLNMGLSMNIHK